MADVDGTWNCTMVTPMGSGSVTLTLSTEGDGLSGTLVSDQGTMEFTGGTVDGNDLAWTVSIQQPMPMQIETTATIRARASRLLRVRICCGPPRESTASRKTSTYSASWSSRRRPLKVGLPWVLAIFAGCGGEPAGTSATTGGGSPVGGQPGAGGSPALGGSGGTAGATPGCGAPMTLCSSGVCSDLQADPLHCGSCNPACAPGQSCRLGSCVDGSGGAGNAGADGATAGTAGDGGVSGAAMGGAAGNGGSGGSAGTSAGGTSGSGNPAGASGAGGGGASGGGGAGAGMGGTGGSNWYPCDGNTSGYNAVMTKSGSTWTVVNGGSQRYSGSDMQAALTAAYSSLSSGRSSKQSILVQGSGDIPATAQLSIPSYTILNVCGTINVSGNPSGSDRSPLYARSRRDIDIPNLKMTGSSQYGLFFRETNNVHLGQIDLRLTSSAGIGIRADAGPNASTVTTFSTNFAIDYVYGSGMGSHIVETYGIDGVDIGTVEGDDVGECGLLLNRSINAEVGLVTCNDCATGTGYAAFRVANDVGKVGSSYPAGNIHVGKVVARGGGRGIFSVSGCGGLTIDEIDIANTGNTSILLQNTYDTTIAAVSGTVNGGLVQISNDTDNTNSGRYAPSQNVHIQNLTLSGGASVRQDWCSQFGENGCTATNVTGGTVSMCN
jgi:hypothetical protein